MLLKKITLPIFLSIAGLFAALSIFAFIPTAQDPGQSTALWTGATVSATPSAQTVACGQGSGAIGRKTLSVWNSPSSTGTVTVTVELRDDTTSANFTSGYLAVNGVTVGNASSDTALPSEAGGRYCRATAVATSTQVFTAVLRRE